jgi:glycosyltransferase involved in cell wall biosynthesis
MALHAEHRERITARYGIGGELVKIVGAGYRDDIFCPPEGSWSIGEEMKTFDIVYAGKISRAKGVPWLIEALDRVRFPKGTRIRLLLAGSAGGDEGRVIQEEAARHGESVVFLGAVHQEVLAHMLREADLFVLPSFY